jgi:hypothetical protein
LHDALKYGAGEIVKICLAEAILFFFYIFLKAEKTKQKVGG